MRLPNPDRSGRPPVRGAGAERFGLPSGPAAQPWAGPSPHCAQADTHVKERITAQRAAIEKTFTGCSFARSCKHFFAVLVMITLRAFARLVPSRASVPSTVMRSSIFIRVPRPTQPHQRVRAAHLESPVGDLAGLLIRDVDVKVDVRIRPFYLRHFSSQGGLLSWRRTGPRRMVSPRGHSRQKHA
jgi:hypothetical protein